MKKKMKKDPREHTLFQLYPVMVKQIIIFLSSFKPLSLASFNKSSNASSSPSPLAWYKTFSELQSLLGDIQQGEGTLGSLAKDPDLYDNLNHAMQNLDLLLQDFRLNPKRYVNVSVFGKKQKDYTVPEEDPAFDTAQIKE